MFSVATKRGERRDGLKGLNYNTNVQLDKDHPGERAKRQSRWAANRKKRGDEDRGKKNGK